MAGVERAQRIGAECIQFFVGSPRTWMAPAVDGQLALRFREAVATAGLRPAIIHTCYLLNLASADRVLWERSLSSLLNSLAWAEELGAAVVTHLGSRGDASEEEAEERVAGALEAALKARFRVRLLVETAAGRKRMGSSFEQLGRLFDRLGHFESLGLCIDTAHLYSTGYDVAKPAGLDDTLAQIERALGLQRLRLVHINDSLVPLGNGPDRHANAGQGYLGEAGLAVVLQHPRLRHLPFITEAPGFDHQGPDAANLEILRRLANEELARTG